MIPTYAQLSASLLETLLDTSRGIPIQEHGDWPLLIDLWAVAAGKPAPSGKTKEEVRIEAVKEIAHYRTLKVDCFYP